MTKRYEPLLFNIRLGNGDCNFTIKSPHFSAWVSSVVTHWGPGERSALWQAPTCRAGIPWVGRGAEVLLVMTRHTHPLRRDKSQPSQTDRRVGR